MTSLLACSTLERPPRIRVCEPEADIREAELAIELGNAYSGVHLYDWQEDILRCWLAKDSNNREYIHLTCGLIAPRQNGKSKGIIVPFLLYKAMLCGENVFYTSHRVDSMREIFNILLEIAGDPDPRTPPPIYPEIHKRVSKVGKGNGHKFIRFKSGGVINFVARSSGAIRGQSIDCIIFDEAQYLTQEQMSDVAPALAASDNPQLVYAGTPPDFAPATGEVFGKARSNALKGKTEGICWHEWSVEEIGDIYDKSRWYAVNPSLGYSLKERTIEKLELFGGMGEEEFARERLAFWSTIAIDSAVNKDAWLDTRLASPKDIPNDFDKMCIGVKFAPNGSAVAISTATLKDDDSFGALIKYETKETATGIEWLVDDIYKQKDKTALVAIDGKSGAEDLRNRLVKKGMNRKAVHVMSTQEVVAAATMLNSFIDDGKFKHVEDRCLDNSAMTSKKRKIGQDGYGFGGGAEVPIESMAAAQWAVRTTKRNPMRKTKGLNYG